MDNQFIYHQVQPRKSLSDFVDHFWMLQNKSGETQKVIILPDGRIDLFLSKSLKKPFHITLVGIDTAPSFDIIDPGALTFAISFKPLASEYILHQSVALLKDSAKLMPDDFLGFNQNDLDDFSAFCEKAQRIIELLITGDLDTRKIELFANIFASKGSLSAKELEAQVYWSHRQINRYFNQQYGMPLKKYCNILRFRASFSQIKQGKFFPEQNFADQPTSLKK